VLKFFWHSPFWSADFPQPIAEATLISIRQDGEPIMSGTNFLKMLDGYGLTTAQIHYRLPDQPSLLQLYVWQEYDLAPSFPTLQRFLEFWRREIDGALHSVSIAHQRLIQPSQYRAVDGVISIH
jgi:uncharacterized protein Usg